MPLAPKTRLGTYEILGPLGTGGMGEVYRAKDLRLGRDAGDLPSGIYFARLRAGGREESVKLVHFR